RYCFVHDLDEKKEVYDSKFYDQVRYKLGIRSLVVWPMFVHPNEPLGILKLDSRRLGVFIENGPTICLLEQVAAVFKLVFSLGTKLALSTSQPTGAEKTESLTVSQNKE